MTGNEKGKSPEETTVCCPSMGTECAPGTEPISIGEQGGMDTQPLGSAAVDPVTREVTGSLSPGDSGAMQHCGETTMIQPAQPAADHSDGRTVEADSPEEVEPGEPVIFDSDTQIDIADGSGLPPFGGRQTLRYLGDYELLRKIAHGGMGVVYRARQVSLNRLVAVKLILAGQFASEAEVQRFRREAEAVARLEHPGIVPIHEIGHDQGHHFFSMPFVQGESLAQRVQQGPIAFPVAVSLIRKVAEAIAYAHAAGVVHRDLKPGNILVDRQGEPKLIDFGLARRLENDSTLTSTGVVLGTPSYMSPEQARGESNRLGPLSDIYSLGAVFYCLLTGRPPFQSSSSIDTLRQVLEREAVEVSTLNPEVPLDLETICHKCLQKDPAKRYHSALALAQDLRQWERGEPISARPVSKWERRVMWVRRNPTLSTLIATTVAAILIGSGASLWFGIVAMMAEGEARRSAESARQSEAKAVGTLARSSYYLAQARWNENRKFEARQLLEGIPQEYRKLEWGLAAREFDPSELTNNDQSGSIHSVAFSPEGSQLVVGGHGSESNLRVLDAATGQTILRLVGHQGTVDGVAYSPDGKRIVSAGSDHAIRVWDAVTGQLKLSLAGHTEPVFCVACRPDGGMIVSGSQDTTIKVWDATTGEATRTLVAHTDRVACVAYSPDGRWIASGGLDRQLIVWDVATGQPNLTLQGHAKSVTGVAFSPDGTRIVSGSEDATLKVWETATGGLLQTLAGHTEAVGGVVFSPDGTRIVSGSQDATLKVWDATTGQALRTMTGHVAGITSVAFSPDGSRIVSGSQDSTLKAWDCLTRPETLRGHTDKVNSVVFSPDGTRIASGSDDRTLKIWDTATGQEIFTLTGHTDKITCVAFSPDGTQLASGSRDKTLQVWDAATGQGLFKLQIRAVQHMLPTQKFEETVLSIAFDPSGKRVVTGNSSSIREWDAIDWKETRVLNPWFAPRSTGSVAYSPDGRRIVSGHFDKTLSVWDLTKSRQLFNLTGHAEIVSGVAFSPDGTRIVSGSHDRTLTTRDPVSGRAKLTLKGHEAAVSCVLYSPDGTRIVSGSWDQTLKVWDAVTGEELRTLKGHEGPVHSVCCSSDGSRIASAGSDHTIRMWDTSLFRPTAEFLRRRWAAGRPAWHQEQALALEQNSKFSAALFHRAWLLKRQPRDPELYDQLHSLHERWKSAGGFEQMSLAPIVREMLTIPRGQ